MIDALVLAGGKSQRMGQPKPLLRFSKDKTFLEQIVSVLRSSQVDRVTVVLGAYAELVHCSVNLCGANVVVNEEYEKGQLSSLIAGLRSLPGDSEAIVLSLVDNPFITPMTVNRLVKTFQQTGSPIIVPVHGGKRGHPTLFGASLYRQLVDAPPDKGARHVVQANADKVTELDVPDSAIAISIDTPSQYRMYLGSDPFSGVKP